MDKILLAKKVLQYFLFCFYVNIFPYPEASG